MDTLSEIQERVAELITKKGLGSFSVGISDWGLYVTYVIALLAVLAIFGFAVYFMITNFKKSLPVLIGIGIVLVVFFALRGIAGGEAYENADKTVTYTENAVRWINTCIFTLYLFFVSAVVAWITSAVSGLFKK